MKNLTKPVDTLAKGVVDGLGAFLSRICLPASEEIGLALRDKVKVWRNKNFVEIAQQAEEKIKTRSELSNPKIHPRVIYKIYENGSWSDSSELKAMWAGLLASSCEENKASDKNMIYIDILSKMSHVEAKLFRYFCKSTQWTKSSEDNIVEATLLFPTVSELNEMSGLEFFEDVDQALSHLQFLGLIMRQAVPTIELYKNKNIKKSYLLDNSEVIDEAWPDSIEIEVTAVGLRLFLKIQGNDKRPSEVFFEKSS